MYSTLETADLINAQRNWENQLKMTWMLKCRIWGTPEPFWISGTHVSAKPSPEAERECLELLFKAPRGALVQLSETNTGPGVAAAFSDAHWKPIHKLYEKIKLQDKVGRREEIEKD